MDDSKQTPTAIEISAWSVKLEGTAYEDARPFLLQGYSIGQSLLSVLANATGLGSDFVNKWLNRFRDTLGERCDQIPAERRVPPPFRLGCNVLREVVASAEEPDLQAMFAELLASGCDADKQSKVHPSFPSIISQLSIADAKTLERFAKGAREIQMIRDPKLQYPSYCCTVQTAANLTGLGVCEWLYDSQPAWRVQDIAREATRSVAAPLVADPTDFRRVISAVLHDAARVIAERVSENMQSAARPIGIKLTDFGRDFIDCCLPDAG